jgi:uridine monophosphate synthetase
MWFLAPGVGAQGGELESALKAGLRKDGKGMLLPVSRAIARAEKPGIAAAEMRDEILHIKSQLNH